MVKDSEKILTTIEKSSANMEKSMGLDASCKKVKKLIDNGEVKDALKTATPFITHAQMVDVLMKGAILLAYKGDGANALLALEKTRFHKSIRQKQTKQDSLYLQATLGVHEWLLAHNQTKSMQRLEQISPLWLSDILITQRLIYKLDGQNPIDRVAYFSNVTREITDLPARQNACQAGAMIYQLQTGNTQKADEIKQGITNPLVIEFAERYLANQ